VSTAYTPGLTITDNTLIRKTRRLPLKGTVLVARCDRVAPDTIIARADLPGALTSLRVAQQLGLEPRELRERLRVKEGTTVEKGQLLGEVKALFGLITSRSESPTAGTVEFISEVTGNVGIRHAPTLVELTAYIPGKVTQTLPEEGAMIETRGALVQGIFGVGGEKQGTIKMVATMPREIVSSDMIDEKCEGGVLIFGGQMTHDALAGAIRVRAAGVVGGSINDADLKKLLGYDIGVAITGREALPLSIIVTEGFGNVPMATRTFELLQSLEGERASVNGATQIRAGVIRPEIIVARFDEQQDAVLPAAQTDLGIGAPIRLIREPFFGELAEVSGLPSEPQRIETGAVVRVLDARLSDGRMITVPRANAELIETG